MKMMINTFLLTCLALLLSCAKTDEALVRSSIQEAKYHLNTMDCTQAQSALDDVSFQDENPDYISVYASVHACKAGYEELTDVFGGNLSGIKATGLIQSFAAFTTSNETVNESTVYASLDKAIDTLISYDGTAQPSTEARNDKFGIKKSGDLSLQALYLLFIQMGKHFALYGNADTAPGVTKGAKGGGGETNSCIFSYTTLDAVAWITTITPGTCIAATGSEGSDLLEGIETAADIKIRLCRGIVYYNNMIDILSNVALPGSSELGDISNIKTALSALMTVAEAAELAGYNLGAAASQNAISTLGEITSQSVCEEQNIERIEKFYAIFFETIY